MKKNSDPLIVNLPNIMALAKDYRAEEDTKTMTSDFKGLKLESKIDTAPKYTYTGTLSPVNSKYMPYSKSPYEFNHTK